MQIFLHIFHGEDTRGDLSWTESTTTEVKSLPIPDSRIPMATGLGSTMVVLRGGIKLVRHQIDSYVKHWRSHGLFPSVRKMPEDQPCQLPQRQCETLPRLNFRSRRVRWCCAVGRERQFRKCFRREFGLGTNALVRGGRWLFITTKSLKSCERDRLVP